MYQWEKFIWEWGTGIEVSDLYNTQTQTQRDTVVFYYGIWTLTKRRNQSYQNQNEYSESSYTNIVYRLWFISNWE